MHSKNTERRYAECHLMAFCRAEEVARNILRPSQSFPTVARCPQASLPLRCSRTLPMGSWVCMSFFVHLRTYFASGVTRLTYGGRGSSLLRTYEWWIWARRLRAARRRRLHSTKDVRAPTTGGLGKGLSCFLLNRFTLQYGLVHNSRT